MIDRDGIRLRWETLGCKLDERGQRLFAANEVRSVGGIDVVPADLTEASRFHPERDCDSSFGWNDSC